MQAGSAYVPITPGLTVIFKFPSNLPQGNSHIAHSNLCGVKT